MSDRHNEKAGTKNHQDGTITVLLQRMTEQRLPRALALKEHVDNGGKLSEPDIKFLEQVFEDAHHMTTHIDFKAHPQLLEIGSKMAALYNEITARALENEKQS